MIDFQRSIQVNVENNVLFSTHISADLEKSSVISIKIVEKKRK